MKRKAKKIIRVRKSEEQKILEQYKSLCLAKQEEREGYRLSLKDAHRRVAKIRQVKAAMKFLARVDLVIINQRLEQNFPYSQAFIHLKEMIVDKIEELNKVQKA